MVDDIRDAEESPGLNESEATFLQLLDELTNGTHIKINDVGMSYSLTVSQLQCSGITTSSLLPIQHRY